MKAIVKYNNIVKIESNGQGLITIHYKLPLAICRLNAPVCASETDILKEYNKVHKMTVLESQLVNFYA